jgi:hypothetical protein
MLCCETVHNMAETRFTDVVVAQTRAAICSSTDLVHGSRNYPSAAGSLEATRQMPGGA